VATTRNERGHNLIQETILAIPQLFARRRPEPSYPSLPEVDEATGETNVPGIYAAGEIAGTPLVKLGLNAGHDLVGRLASELQSLAGSDDGDLLDLVIVGSGSSGFSATLHAHELGLSYVTLEAAAFANTFVTMTKGKWLFAEPDDVENRSYGWFEECTKEDLLERWRATIEERGLHLHEQEKVQDIQGAIDGFTITTDVGRYRARRVLLCLGKAGNPRKLGVPGEKENAAKIHHRLLDPDDFHGEDVLIVGAGDVACEAAIALAESNRVTLSAIDTELVFPRKRNIDAVRELEATGKLSLQLASSVREVRADEVVIELADGERRELANSVVFEMIGAELPLAFLKKIGIRLAGSWYWQRWAALVAIFVSVYSLYALKSYGKGAVAWPFEGLISAAAYDGVLTKLFQITFLPFSGLFSESAIAEMTADRGYMQGYLYSLFYTLAMFGFGYEALIRWRAKARDPRYQTWRYVSLISFQLGFFLIVNLVAVQALSVKYAWRAWGLYQPFPLFFNTFFWWYPGDPKWIVYLFVGAGVLGTFVAIPVLSRNHGKRFCTWICGCGGLAETLGDRWRHLSPKGDRSRAWEFQAAAVLLASVLVGVVVVGMYQTDGNNPWWRTYSYLVDFWLVAVIPITLYPFFGGKVWCRYWCPLAAYNQILSAKYGRLKIVADEKCITCTECSKYCQVGVDVMAFAKNQQPFDNSNSSCIHCGICIDVCPMDVLSFENSDPLAVDLIAIGRSSGMERLERL
jgi:NosR/NirI family nitrous oxide reductase transcriptional regulator